MICARSRHLKCTARDKASAISIKIVAGDWLKSQNLTKNLLFSLFFWAKFGRNVVAFAFAEFCCHGIWGAGSNRAREFSHISRHFGLRCTRGSFLSVFILNVFIIFRFLVLNTVEDSDQLFRLILKRVIHFTRNDSKGENAFKGFVLLPASLSHVLHVAMFNLSTDTWERTIRNCKSGYRLPLSAIVFKHECKNVVFPKWKLFKLWLESRS